MQKNKLNSKISNAIKDQGNGLLMFSKPLVITDDSVMWSGARYDIKSMDIDAYDGKITANHSDDIQDIIGEVVGLKKGRNKITVDGIKFAIDKSALAQFTHDMMLDGLITDVSIETIGPWPNDDGIFENSSLVGLSVVVTGNNKSARLNKYEHVFANSIAKAKENNLDTSLLEEEFSVNNTKALDNEKNKHDNNNRPMLKTVKNTRDFAVEVKYTNAAGDEIVKNLQPNETLDVTEKEAEKVENQIKDAQAPKEEKKVDNGMEKILSKLEEMEKKNNELEQKIFDNGAKEPVFKVNSNKFNKEIKDTDYKQRHADQILHAWDWLKGGSRNAHDKLTAINELHLDQLKEKGIVPNMNPVTRNQITIADFGNFVISPELLTDIEGFRSDYASLISRLDWRETMSLQMAWLKRSGDINMQEVEMCDDGEDGNRKPISEYGAEPTLANMHELAAVTPVCNAATRFLAVDLLGDVAQGYRTDYDRKRAQLAIARFQQAINSTGNSTVFNQSTDTDAVKSFIKSLRPVAERVMNGTFIMNHSTYWQLVENLVGAGISGPLSGLFTTGDQPAIVGRPYIVVPDDLLPTLGQNETKSFTIEGVTVTIDQAVIYADLSTFTGRTSGGLQYDLSTEAAYEVVGQSGTEVRSAYQRNELVLRGSFFRNGAVKDDEKVAGLSDFSIS